MLRTISGYRQDEAAAWVALLDCGHGRHVRHNPPFVNRAWVTTPQGRQEHLGDQLDCVRCDRMEWPEGFEAYNSTPEFDERNVPAGLLSRHSTKRGVWARIEVKEGCLEYRIEPPIAKVLALRAGVPGVVVPEVKHRVAPLGRVRFRVTFYRKQTGAD